MKEKDRNYRLMLLITKLHKENDKDSLELLKSMVDNDTPAMKKSFEIMTQNTSIADFLGVKTLSDLPTQSDADEKYNYWKENYIDDIAWEEFRDTYFKCDKCKRWLDEQCICYAR